MQGCAALLLLVAALWVAPSARGEYTTADGEWPQYGGNLANSKYSPLEQIEPGNVERVRVAWTWDSIDNAILEVQPGLRPEPFKGTPLMIDGVLYVRTSLSLVAAIDAETGGTLWIFDPRSYADRRFPTTWGYHTRGLGFWRSGGEERLLLATRNARLVALDPKSGEPVEDFGEKGVVDLLEGYRRPITKPEMMNFTMPPLVCCDVVVMGSVVHDELSYFRGEEPPLDVPPGDVRGYDARSGKLLWTFYTVPGAGEPGVETWGDDSWRWVGHTNVWSISSADEELGLAYLPVTAPTNDWWGGFRPGDNLYGSALVAVDCQTGKRIWHFQTVHHPLWDYDLAAPPNLVEIEVDGKPIRAVAQLGKTAFTYVFDRATGKPVWPIVERPVPASTVPGERMSPTQPFPTRPPPFDRQEIGEDDLIAFTPELRAEAARLVGRYDHGSIFTPVSLRGTIQLPGEVGGATWTGGAFDPETHVLYVTSQTQPIIVSLWKPSRSWWPWSRNAWPFEYGKVKHDPTLSGLPFLKPPWARITAIDLDRGEIVWQVPNGDGPRHSPRLLHLDLPPLGTVGNSGVLVTKTLLFAATTGAGTFTKAGAPGPAKFRAFDKRTGGVVWEHDLEPSYDGGGAPMSYRWKGRQYVVVPTGGGAANPARLVAFALDGGGEARKTSAAHRAARDAHASAAGADPVALREGARVFLARCAACHTIGYGRLQGPDLYGVWNLGERGLHDAIEAMKTTQGVEIDDRERELLVDFLRHEEAIRVLDELRSQSAP